MSTQRKLSIREKEQRLLQRIERAKQDLTKLKHKRRLEIGQLACEVGLDQLDNQQLKTLFHQLMSEQST